MSTTRSSCWVLDATRTALGGAVGQLAEPVYAYIVRSIRVADDEFDQCGSAPNFEGGYLTLCTCKHAMRTFQTIDSWPSHWIAGFTGIGSGRNYLVFLARIQYAFASHRDLWLDKRLSASMKHSKSTRTNPYGDLYEPKRSTGSPLDPSAYYAPRSDHSHAHDWHGDVSYEGRSGRSAALLVADPHATFVWRCPLLYNRAQLSRGQRKMSLSRLVAGLAERAEPAETPRPSRGVEGGVVS